jgi:acetyltransferase-like isoleucine patch superfamily enzyme
VAITPVSLVRARGAEIDFFLDPLSVTYMGPTTQSQLQLYLRRQASGPARYFVEQLLLETFGWMPTLAGIALRSLVYRLILTMQGIVAIEKGVRIRFASNVTLDRGAYLDQGVYLHACPNGIRVGKNSLVMYGSVLHVYNFRGIPHSGIWIGDNSLIGEYNVIRGQGGVKIGNRVYTSPMVQMVAVNHAFDDPSRPFVDQGITAQGITVEDDVWIGSGAILTDGISIGRGSVVAAGSVVTRDVAPYTVVAGTPARFIREVGDTTKRSEHLETYL